MKDIEYLVNHPIAVAQLCDIYDRAGLRRPTSDPLRMECMLKNANLVVSAWIGPSLVGIARAFTDYGWVCYLSDLAVDKAIQRRGIGRELIARVQREMGPYCQLVLLSSPEAMDYYPKVGFEPIRNGFIIKRSKP